MRNARSHKAKPDDLTTLLLGEQSIRLRLYQHRDEAEAAVHALLDADAKRKIDIVPFKVTSYIVPMVEGFAVRITPPKGTAYFT